MSRVRSAWAWNALSLLILGSACVVGGLLFRPFAVRTGPPETSRLIADPNALADVSGLDAREEAATSAESDRQTMQRLLGRLQSGLKRYEAVDEYTTVFTKQERLGGKLREPQVIRLKVRNEPFQLYLKWIAGCPDREVLYIEGENDGRMIVNPGGWKSRLSTALKLDPQGATALRESRYPVTNLGLCNLLRKLIANRTRDLNGTAFVECRALGEQEFAGRMCDGFLVRFTDLTSSTVYRKSWLLLDQETNAPLCLRNFTWPEGDQASLNGDELDAETLIEVYSYTETDTTAEFVASDFDIANPDYRFRR